VPIVTITGDDPGIVATVRQPGGFRCYEARSTLLVDVDPTTCSVSERVRVRPDPGLSGIITGSSTWPEALYRPRLDATDLWTCFEWNSTLGFTREKRSRRGQERTRSNAATLRFHHYCRSHSYVQQRKQHHTRTDVISLRENRAYNRWRVENGSGYSARRRHARPWPRTLGCRDAATGIPRGNAWVNATTGSISARACLRRARQ